MPYKFNTTQQRSRLMQRIREKDTSPEVAFRKVLWHQGIRYHKHDKSLIGKPDINIYKYRIAVFIDGEFWHGFNWNEKSRKIKSNRDYWISKIEGNIARDHEINKLLEEKGWLVLRFWQSEIEKCTDHCLKQVLRLIDQRARTVGMGR